MDEEEINNFDLEQDEDEIQSTTECTTNDEMDLESASANANHIANQLSQSQQKFAQNHQEKAFKDTNTLIDDYLGVQNLEKEEILAAKINKFLSVNNRNKAVLLIFW